jgi:hypothetical protein
MSIEFPDPRCNDGRAVRLHVRGFLQIADEEDVSLEYHGCNYMLYYPPQDR